MGGARSTPFHVAKMGIILDLNKNCAFQSTVLLMVRIIVTVCRLSPVRGREEIGWSVNPLLSILLQECELARPIKNA